MSEIASINIWIVITDYQGAIKVAQSAIAEVKKLQIPHSQSLVSQYVTMSLGISSQIHRQELQPKLAIAAADAALYQAKQHSYLNQSLDGCTS